MKMLFSYTGPIIKDSQGNYYGRTINDNLISRYLKICDEINFLTRIKIEKKNENLKKYSKIQSKKIMITEYPNIYSPKIILTKLNELNNIIENEVKKSDMIIVRLPDIVGNLTIKYAIKYNKPYFVELVGCPFDSLWNHSIKGKIIAPFLYFSTRKAIKNAPYVLYVTNKFLQNRYECKNMSIGCSDVSLKQIDESILEKRINRINNKNNKIVIGSLGAVDVKYKGYEYVIEAISKLKKEGYKFEYKIVGGGNKEYLTNLASKLDVKDEIKLIGPLPHNEVFEWLDNIDVYIQPSLTEGLPRSVIEAMSRGCLVSGSSVGGIPELIPSDYIFTKKNMNEICEILKKIDKNALIEQAKANFDFSKRFEFKLLEEKRMNFYKIFVQDGGLKDD